jgi:glycosyltransferase involved in cell wall biosynthesis
MLPFWGRPDHFKLAVESVLAQDDPDWTLTIVDDLYPDPEPERWVAELGDPRITYIRNEENLGVSRNYIKCVSLMNSTFSVMFGCDDVMRPGYVRRVKELISAHPGADFFQPGVRVIDSEGTQYLPLPDRLKNRHRVRGRGVQVLHGESLAVSLLRGNWTYFPSLVWRVDLLRRYGFDQDLDVVQDLIMLMDITAGGGTFVLDDTVVFEYRRHATSVSSAKAFDGSRFAQERALFQQESERFGRLGWTKAARAARRHTSSRLHALTRVPGALRMGQWRGARTLLTHALGGDVSGLADRPARRSG